MPEDYQAILDDLGVDTSGNTDGQTTNNQDNTPVNPTSNDTTPPATDDSNPDNGTQDPATDDEGGQQSTDNQEDKRRNEAFAAMRSDIAKYKKFMQHIMKGAGFQGTEEEFMNNLTEASYQRQAKLQGNQVSPEILKRMDQLENQNNTLLEQRNMELFTQNLVKLQNQLELKDNEIKEFVEWAARERIDLTKPGTDFAVIYRGLYYDKLRDRDIEKARQEWIAQNTKADSASNPDGKSGKKDPTPTNVNTMAEFDSLLQSIPNNNK